MILFWGAANVFRVPFHFSIESWFAILILVHSPEILFMIGWFLNQNTHREKILFRIPMWNTFLFQPLIRYLRSMCNHGWSKNSNFLIEKKSRFHCSHENHGYLSMKMMLSSIYKFFSQTVIIDFSRPSGFFSAYRAGYLKSSFRIFSPKPNPFNGSSIRR